MANPLGIFFSRLAPEDKRFIRRIGFFLIFMLLLSGAALYVYTHYIVKNTDQPEPVNSFEMPDAPPNIATDTTDFELPPPPVIPNVPDIIEETTNTTDQRTTESSSISVTEITGMLLNNYKLAAKWGHLLLDAGYPNEAIYILQKGVPMDSAPIPVIIDLAYAHFRSKNAEEGLNELEKALAKFPGDAELLTAKAAIIGEHPDTTRRGEADEIFKTALKKNPNSAEANYQYGRYIMQMGNFQKSYSYLDNAVKLTPPQNPHYIARLGMAEFYLKHDANAEALYKRALTINPSDYNTWFNLGELYLSKANESSFIPEIQQKTRQALESYLKAIENDSLHAKAHFRIGLILNRNGGYREAVKHLSIALDKMPNNIPIMHQLSSVYMQLGDTAKSVRYLENILQLDPFDKIAANEYKRIKGN